MKHFIQCLQEGLEAPPEEEQPVQSDLVLEDDEDLSFASMFNSMRLEESDAPAQPAQPRDINPALSELDPVIAYGSYGQVRFSPSFLQAQKATCLMRLITYI